MSYLEKYFGGARKEADDQLSIAFLQMAQRLLRSIRVHAVRGDEEAYSIFQSELRELEASLGDKPLPSQMLLIAGAVDQALNNYSRQISRYVTAQRAELQKMIATLTGTVTAISTGSERSLSKLESIGTQIQKASVIEDIRLMNVRLSECLQSVQEETLRQKQEAAKTITFLRSGLERRNDPEQASIALDVVPEADAVTGLPGRTAAEAVLEKALQEGSRSFVVIFVLKGLVSLNLRSGRAVGDQALKHFSQDLCKRFTRAHQTFRWGGPCFLTVFESADPFEKLQGEVSRITARRLELTIETKTGSAILPLSSSATLVSMLTVRSVEALTQQIESMSSS